MYAYIHRNLQRQDFTVEEEPHYRSMEGLREPGIVATMVQPVVVLDMQVAGQSSNLEQARRENIRKCAKTPDINRELTRTIGGSAKDHTLAVIATQVVIGGYNCRLDFHCKTAEVTVHRTPTRCSMTQLEQQG